ncbi:AMFR [Symbiodinium microadriaticum]|nr:AMFR [Symbiodinium sp. KB8]CAE7332638.1 AMFR [Symbiodinium microadriaticum]
MNCTLMFSLCAAFLAACISGWLLFVMMPHYLFAIVILMTLMTCFAGLYIPYRCTRQRLWLVMPTTNLIWSTVLSIAVNAAVIAIDSTFVTEVYNMADMLDNLVRLLVAMAGLAMGVSMDFFLVHYLYAHEAPEIRRLKRKVWKMLVGGPSAQLVECDNLASSCPGGCAICLEPLSELREDLAFSPQRGSKVSQVAGLLQLPCGHAFHGECADKWMVREVSCPMCRKSFGSLRHCRRICLRPGAHFASPGGTTPSTPSVVDVTAIFTEEEGSDECPDLCESQPNPNRVNVQVLGRCLDVEDEEEAWRRKKVVSI